MNKKQLAALALSFAHFASLDQDLYDIPRPALRKREPTKRRKSSGWRNFMWGGDVRKATPDEVTAFMEKVFNSEPIKNY